MKLLKTGEIHTECAGINRHGVSAAMRTFGFGPVVPGRGQALVNRTNSLYVPEHRIDALLGLALKLSDGERYARTRTLPLSIICT